MGDFQVIRLRCSEPRTTRPVTSATRTNLQQLHTFEQIYAAATRNASAGQGSRQPPGDSDSCPQPRFAAWQLAADLAQALSAYTAPKGHGTDAKSLRVSEEPSSRGRQPEIENPAPADIAVATYPAARKQGDVVRQIESALCDELVQPGVQCDEFKIRLTFAPVNGSLLLVRSSAPGLFIRICAADKTMRQIFLQQASVLLAKLTERLGATRLITISIDEHHPNGIRGDGERS